MFAAEMKTLPLLDEIVAVLVTSLSTFKPTDVFALTFPSTDFANVKPTLPNAAETLALIASKELTMALVCALIFPLIP